MKIIIVGDIHCDFVGPKSRTENFYSCFLDKMKQINEIAETNKIQHIICLGDFFENYVVDYFEKIIFDLSPILSTKQWYSVIGNHDNKKVDGADSRGTSFGALLATNLLKTAEEIIPVFEKENIKCDIFNYYNRDLFDNNKTNNDQYNIAFIHEFVMPQNTKANFEFKKCQENNYDFVFCGHYHYSFDEMVGKTRYINPGSLMRLTIAEEDINRRPKIIIFDTVEKSINYIFLDTEKLEQKKDNNLLTQEFESRFTKMLIDNQLTQGNSNDIISLLKSNKIDDAIIKYVEEKAQNYD